MSKFVRKWLVPGDTYSSAWIGYDDTDIEIADCNHKITLHFSGPKGKRKFYRLWDMIFAFGAAKGWLEDGDNG